MVAVGVGGHAFGTCVVVTVCGVTPRTWVPVGPGRKSSMGIVSQFVMLASVRSRACAISFGA
jgi:hypothetical protein